MGTEHIVVCGVNWIGDAVMSMPALDRLRARRPDARLTVLAKPSVAPLWRMHDAPDEVLELMSGAGGVWRAAAALRARAAAEAWVLPHSPRSALIPFLARVPRRVGTPGLGRSLLLHRVVRPSTDPDRRHQAYEYLDLFFPGEEAPLEAPRLRPPEAARAAVRERLAGIPRPLVGLMPGAARGPSKQWPAVRFADLAGRLAREIGCGVAVMGAPSERGLCAGIAQAAEGRSVNLAGQTDIGAWAAALSLCAIVVANDSGGMHLASALGAPVVALYGITDPSRTGPLGARTRILQHADRRARDVRRDDPEARRALERISVNEVFDAVREGLSQPVRELA